MSKPKQKEQASTAPAEIQFPGVEGYLLEGQAYWVPGIPGCAKRLDEIDVVVGHWTAGEANFDHDEDDAPRLFRALQGRVNNGVPSPLSIHANIGGFGRIVRMADEKTTSTFHAGAVNQRSIGVEIHNMGFGEPRSKRPRGERKNKIHGRTVTFLEFTDAQIASWVKLCEYYVAAFGIPRVVPGNPETGELFLDRLTGKRAANFRGFTEHLHWSSKKADGGGQLVQALVDAGFKLG